jgi:hypothetical protein
MRVLMALLRFVLGGAVLGCIAASCFFAFEFGTTRSDNSWIALGYGLVALSLDLLKSGLPIFSSESSDRAHKVACWIAFAFLTCMSLWCAYGMTATQLADRIATKITAQTDVADKRATLTRLQNERAKMVPPNRMTQGAVDAQQATVTAISDQAKVEAGNGGCGRECGNRQREEREARAKLVQMQADLAATLAFDELEADIKSAEVALNAANKPEANKQADPQTENMAKVLNVSADSVALVSHAVLAVAIEIGSGLGFWLVFGHGGVQPRQPIEATQPAASKHAESDDEARLRFFRDCVTAATGERVSASVVHGVYSGWCAGQGRVPLSPQVFGKEAPWPKDKIGGNVWYLNCRLLGAHGRCFRSSLDRRGPRAAAKTHEPLYGEGSGLPQAQVSGDYPAGGILPGRCGCRR